jgi:flagellar hook assembly protein FlgD
MPSPSDEALLCPSAQPEMPDAQILGVVSAGAARDGKGNDGTQWPDGQYKLTATAADTAGNAVAVNTQIQGVVNSVDLTQSPPLLSINGQNYLVNQIKSIAQ